MTPEELRDAAIAKWAAAQDSESKTREAERAAERKRKTAQNQERIPLLLGADPSLAQFAPFATAAGIWIALPECMPIRLDPNGGFSVCRSEAPERDGFSMASYACDWHLGEAITHARREWLDLAEQNKRYAAEEAAREAESEAHKHDPKPEPEKPTDERIADALEKMVVAMTVTFGVAEKIANMIGKFPVSKLP